MHTQEFQEFLKENVTENHVHPVNQLNSTTGSKPMDEEQVRASGSDSTNPECANAKDSINRINRELLMSVIDDLTLKQKEFQGRESASLSRIMFLENELKDSQLKHVICAKVLAKAHQDLEDAQSKIKQKDRALSELRKECNALNTSAHGSNEAVELHDTQAPSNDGYDDAVREMRQTKDEYNAKLSKMKTTFDAYKQKMKETIERMQQQATNSLDQLDFDEI